MRVACRSAMSPRRRPMRSNRSRNCVGRTSDCATIFADRKRSGNACGAVLIVDGAGAPVPNATVTLILYRNWFFYGANVQLPRRCVLGVGVGVGAFGEQLLRSIALLV